MQQAEICVTKSLMKILEEAIKEYPNNLLTVVEIIDELIRIAREINVMKTNNRKKNTIRPEVILLNNM